MPLTLYIIRSALNLPVTKVTFCLGKVAVVALLTRLKASPPLTMLIIGEALLNDGNNTFCTSFG